MPIVGGSHTGKAFEEDTRRSLQSFGAHHDQFWFMRLSDYRSWIAVSKKLLHSPQPADFMAIYRGVPYFIECKSTIRDRGWDSNFLKPHQHNSLCAIDKAGGSGWILIRHTVPYNNRTWAVSINLFDKLKAYLPGRRVSFSWDLLDAKAIPLTRSGRVWDLAPIFNGGV